MSRLLFLQIPLDQVLTPEPGYLALFVDSADGVCKSKDSDGVVRPLGGGGGGDGLRVADEGQDYALPANKINFVGPDIQTRMDANGTLNVFVPPLLLSSTLGTTNGTTDARWYAPNMTQRYLSAGSGKLGDWAPAAVSSPASSLTTLRPCVTGAGTFQWASSQGTFAIAAQTQTIRVRLRDSSGAQLAEILTPPLTGNFSLPALNGAFQVDIYNYAPEFFQWRAQIRVSVQPSALLDGGSGKYSLEVVQLDGATQVATYGDAFFYDRNGTLPSIAGPLEILLAPGYTVRSMSGVRYLFTGGLRTKVEGIQALNQDTYPATQVLIQVPELAMGTDSLQGGNLTNWTNSFSIANVSFLRPSWGIPAGLRLFGPAALQAYTRDWADTAPVASPGLPLLVDTVADQSSSIIEKFQTESRRLRSDLQPWDPTAFLPNQDGGQGLQVRQGLLLYPPAVNYQSYYPDPQLQPDYRSLAGGPKTYLRRYNTQDGSSKSNGSFYVVGATEQDLAQGRLLLDISTDAGARWFSLNSPYLGGPVNVSGQGCRADGSEPSMQLGQNRIKFTLGQGGTSSQVWLRITFAAGAQLQISQFSLLDW